jgi:hypothetical protein
MLTFAEIRARITEAEQLPLGFNRFQFHSVEDAFGGAASYMLNLSPGRIKLAVSPHFKAIYDLNMLLGNLSLTKPKRVELHPNNLFILEWES